MKFLKSGNWVSIFVAIIMGMIIIASRMMPDNIFYAEKQKENKEVIPVDIDAESNVVDIYTLRLSGIDENNNTLLFFTNHQEVYAYIGGELVYSLEKAGTIFGGTTGSKWNMITLPLKTKEIQIKIVQIYPELSKQSIEFEVGSAISMYENAIQGAVSDLVIASVVQIMGFALLAYWLIVFRKVDQQRELLYLGLFAVIFGLWNFEETHFAVFMFGNRAFWSYLAFTCIMCMCLPGLYFFRAFMEVKDKYLYKIITAYIVGKTIVCQILHLTGVMGVKQTALFNIISVALILLYLLFAIIMSLKDKKHHRKIVINMVGLVILVLSATLDVISYYNNTLKSTSVAKFGFLIYVIILGIETTRTVRQRLQEEQKMEILREMALKDMLTGCFNRNSFTEDVESITELEGIQILGFDLNDLKKCNDTRGHQAGDEYISDAAHVIEELFGEYGKLYRIGGDEFCIIAKHVPEDELERKKKALHVASAHYRLDHPESEFGIAYGYATFDAKLDKTLEDTRARADVRMYKNKKETKKH